MQKVILLTKALKINNGSNSFEYIYIYIYIRFYDFLQI